MAALNNIIIALGLNSTIWLQLGIFIVCYLFLSTIVFQPYFRAFKERQSKTVGGQEKAEQVYAQTRELESLYQRKARALNAELKDIYDKARSEAVREQERIQAEAREKSKVTVEKAKERIQDEINRAREDLLKEAPDLSHSITANLLSREVKL